MQQVIAFARTGNFEGMYWRNQRIVFRTSHNPVQDFYFGEDFLLRRHDYNVDVAGGFGAAQCSTTSLTRASSVSRGAVA
jgi:hypothetical protein